MNIDKQYAWQSGSNSNNREKKPFIGKSGCGKTTVIFNLMLQLVGLQSLVRFWKESPPTGVQGAEERV